MAKNQRHIVKNPKGGWSVKKPGQSKPTSNHRTQSGAEKRAKGDLRKEGGGEAVIHGRDGRFRDSDTVAPANDPNPPKDRKH